MIIIMANNYYILSVFYHARQCARLCMVIIVLDPHGVLRRQHHPPRAQSMWVTCSK